MLKKNLDEFSSVFEKLNKTWGIVTAGDRQTGLNGMTVSWGGIGVLWNKPVCFLFIRKSRYTYKYMEESKSVTLSFVSDEYKEDKVFFGRESGRHCEKFEKTRLHAALDVDMNCYYVAEADEVLKLQKLYSVELTYNDLPEELKEQFYATDDIHKMYVCEIKQYLVKEK